MGDDSSTKHWLDDDSSTKQKVGDDSSTKHWLDDDSSTKHNADDDISNKHWLDDDNSNKHWLDDDNIVCHATVKLESKSSETKEVWVEKKDAELESKTKELAEHVERGIHAHEVVTNDD